MLVEKNGVEMNFGKWSNSFLAKWGGRLPLNWVPRALNPVGKPGMVLRIDKDEMAQDKNDSSGY